MERTLILQRENDEPTGIVRSGVHGAHNITDVVYREPSPLHDEVDSNKSSVTSHYRQPCSAAHYYH